MILENHLDAKNSFAGFNGFFGIESYVLHDPENVNNLAVCQQTETDVLAIRMPHSRETFPGSLIHLQKYEKLVSDHTSIDVVIAEAKSKDQKTPNKTWNKADPTKASKCLARIASIVRFVGVYSDEECIKKAAEHLREHYCYADTLNKYCFKYIVFSEVKCNDFPLVTYITYYDAIEFLVKERACWQQEQIALRSKHEQWPEFINKIFCIINTGLGHDEKIAECLKSLHEYFYSKEGHR